MKNKLKKAFTLVELIVVVTILAIIWTIWFVSYTDYLSWVRDTNRTVQLESIWDWLKLSLTRWRLPIPDDYIEVKTNWNTIAYQGYAWEEVLKKIKYDKEGKDPLDNTYFSYYATDNRKNFQLMALLEETNETVSLYNRKEVLSNDIDYADRQVKVSWKKLWILTGGWDNLNVPVQEIWEIKDNWELDIATTPEEYISHIDDSDKISWDWSELIKSIYNSSCKRILESSLDNWDWIYKINPGTEEFEVYCDMENYWITDFLMWEWDFKNGKDISTQSWSNPTNTIVNIESPVNSWYAIHQTSNSSAEYEVHFIDATKCKKNQVFRMRSWVADNSGTIFHHRFYDINQTSFYVDWNQYPSPNILEEKNIWWKTWKLEEVKWVLSKDVYDFNWYIWYNAENPKDLYFTWVRLSCLTE